MKIFSRNKERLDAYDNKETPYDRIEKKSETISFKIKKSRDGDQK